MTIARKPQQTTHKQTNKQKPTQKKKKSGSTSTVQVRRMSTETGTPMNRWGENEMNLEGGCSRLSPSWVRSS